MLYFKYLDGPQDKGDKTQGKYIKVKMLFNSYMIDFFKAVILKSWYNVCLPVSRRKLKIIDFLGPVFTLH